MGRIKLNIISANTIKIQGMSFITMTIIPGAKCADAHLIKFK